MSFKDAAAFQLLFGKYKGKTLDDIGATDTGLLYLDWLRGEKDKEASDMAKRTGYKMSISIYHQAVRAYLDDPGIAAELKMLL